MMITKKDIEKVLQKIPDPEIGVSLWDLGLIYNIAVDKKGTVDIIMTLTTIGCPLFEVMDDQIKKELKKINGVKKIHISLTFEPPWSVDRMSRTAKSQLGFL